MDMSTAKNVTIAVILVGTALYLYSNKDRLFGVVSNRRNVTPSRRSKPLSPAMQELCNAFIMYASSFQGLYEPLFKASIGALSHERMRNLFTEWDIRMNGIAHIPICLKSWWATIVPDNENMSDEALQKRAQLFVQLIRLCGIVRDDKTEIVAKEDTGMYYQRSDGEELIAGQKLRVESPCWYLPSNPVRVIEKGYCEIL